MQKNISHAKMDQSKIIKHIHAKRCKIKIKKHITCQKMLNQNKIKSILLTIFLRNKNKV